MSLRYDELRREGLFASYAPMQLMVQDAPDNLCRLLIIPRGGSHGRQHELPRRSLPSPASNLTVPPNQHARVRRRKHVREADQGWTPAPPDKLFPSTQQNRKGRIPSIISQTQTHLPLDTASSRDLNPLIAPRLMPYFDGLMLLNENLGNLLNATGWTRQLLDHWLSLARAARIATLNIRSRDDIRHPRAEKQEHSDTPQPHF
ncbi:hypothetical protein SeMB42_g02607 [Synchytrium endobioticum]|uniref:Uncharacterized protein n=1 Tax=Synchytrium endobioticum TaxID=286115 RepID=A0A507DD29_9FUNG|nr:hypothetical protein SeMB42_g02607 [Synchytrium endobioticum]TPX50629.1 hypothetical protein SeLEV6574_g00803 [Synchytrium endobioticum]